MSSNQLLPENSDRERDPRDDEKESEKNRQYEENRPPHHE
jgi:hypothetical protein